MLFQLLLDSSDTLFVSDLGSLTSIVFKILFILGAFLYVLFSIVVVRQISIMRSTLVTDYSAILTTLGYIHLLLSIGVLWFFVISL